MNRRVFFVSSGRLRAYQFDGQLGASLEFLADERGLTDFSVYLQESVPDPVYVLVDFVEEEFREDTVPHVFGADRSALLRTRLSRLFRDATYSHAVAQGRQREGRRDDRYLFTALIRPDLLAPWMGQLSKHKVPVAGVYSLSLLGAELLKALKLESRNLLLVSLQSSGGLRQSFFEEGKLRISRLAMLPDPSPDRFAGFLLSEVERLRRYLTSLRMLPQDSPLDVYILGSERVRAEIQRQSPSPINIRHHVLNLQDVAERVGIKGEYQTRFSDRIFCHLLARRAPANQFAPTAQTRYFRLHRARRALVASAILVLLGGLGLSAAKFVDGLVAIQDTESAARQAAFYEERYELARARLPATPDSTSILKRVVDGAVRLGMFETSPVPMMQTLSRGLAGFPEVRLSEVRWSVTTATQRPQRELTDLERALRRGSAEPDGGRAGIQEVAIVRATISPFDGDYRAALETVRRFADGLRQLPQVDDVRVESMPLDIGPDATLSGSTREQVADERAVFELRVALKPREAADEAG